jgi:hypothetical protein
MSTAKFDTLSTLDGSYSVPVSTVAQGTARAWVNFNGTGTVAIRASFNVSSITDNGTGIYTLNFTTALPDANYCAAGMCTYDVSGWGDVEFNNATPPTTSALSIRTIGYTSYFDPEIVTVAIFR